MNKLRLIRQIMVWLCMAHCSFASDWSELPNQQLLDEQLASALNDPRNADYKKIEELINAGADPNVRGDFGTTLLLVATRFGQEELIKLLINKGANINVAMGYIGTTPLMIAAFYGYVRIVQLLIQSGVDVNRQDTNGDTALYDTLKGMSRDRDSGKPMDTYLLIFKALIDAGAIDIENNKGKTVLDSARALKNKNNGLSRYLDQIIRFLTDIEILRNAHKKAWIWAIYQLVDTVQPKLLGVRLKEIRAQLPADVQPTVFEALRLKREYPIQWKQFITSKK